MPNIYGINQIGSKGGAQPIWYGDPVNPKPFTVSNISSNNSTNIWIGFTQSAGPTDHNSTPISSGGYLSYDGTEDVYYASADGPSGLVVVYSGVTSVFLPSGLTFVTFPSNPPAEDPSTPAAVSTNTVNGPSVTTASFTPPANSLLVACINVGDAGTTVNVTISDTGAHTWTSRVSILNTTGNSGNGTDQYSVIFTAPVTTSSTITVTAKNNDVTNNSDIQLAVRVVVNANANQSTAAIATNNAQAVNTSVTITPTKIGSLIYVVGDRATPNSTDAALSGTSTLSQIFDAGINNLRSVGKCTANTTVLAPSTFGWTDAISNGFSCVALEIVP